MVYKKNINPVVLQPWSPDLLYTYSTIPANEKGYDSASELVNKVFYVVIRYVKIQSDLDLFVSYSRQTQYSDQLLKTGTFKKKKVEGETKVKVFHLVFPQF